MKLDTGSMKRQRGVSLVGLIFIGLVLTVFVAVGTKVAPAVLEYFLVVKNINALIESGDARGTVTEIRKAYDRRATIDETQSVTGADLDISKSGGEVVIAVSYSRKVPIMGPVNVCLDFNASTRPSKAAAGR